MDKKPIFNNWNFMRWLRLVLAMYVAVQAVETLSLFLGIVAVIFMFQTINNTAYCGENNCTLPIKKAN